MSETTTRPARPGPTILRDAALPAARFLAGTGAADILRVPIEAAGGRLHAVRVRHVHYRPGSDVVVRCSTDVSWNGGPIVRDTHMASSTVHDLHPGTVPVVADVDGDELRVGVWRWPFDPVLPGLGVAATPRSAAALVGVDDLSGVALRLVSFRPTVRAVFELTTPRRTVFVKVVPPHEAAAVIDRHAAATDAGVPAARVVASRTELGIIVLDGLTGTTLREVVRSGIGELPDSAEFDRLDALFAAVDLTEPRRVPDRWDHARLHARMLAAVMPAERSRLDDLGDAIASTPAASATCIVHGDLHEGQLLVRDGRTTGVIDLDDLGLGSALDERANLLGFLRYRAATRPAMRARVDAYADRIRAGSARSFDLQRLDTATAAVLVGLATGPYRVQQRGWQATASLVLDAAESHLTSRRLRRPTRHRAHSSPFPHTSTKETS